MRKLTVKDLTITGGALLFVSASAIDAGILMGDITDVLPADGSWYLVGPLAVWTAASTAASFALFNRLMHQIEPRREKVSVHVADDEARTIQWRRNGQTNTIFASFTRWAIAGQPDPQPEIPRRLYWRVPVEDHTITVHEIELKTFLEGCYRRRKHQFSRRYWTRERKPPLWRPKYEAFIRILVEAGLIEGRYDGASGRLVMHPRQALLTLRNVSGFLPEAV